MSEFRKGRGESFSRGRGGGLCLSFSKNVREFSKEKACAGGGSVVKNLHRRFFRVPGEGGWGGGGGGWGGGGWGGGGVVLNDEMVPCLSQRRKREIRMNRFANVLVLNSKSSCSFGEQRQSQ